MQTAASWVKQLSLSTDTTNFRQNSDRQQQFSNRKNYGCWKFDIVSKFSPSEFFSPKLGIFGWNFPTKTFFDNFLMAKNLGGPITYNSAGPNPRLCPLQVSPSQSVDQHHGCCKACTRCNCVEDHRSGQSEESGGRLEGGDFTLACRTFSVGCSADHPR